MGELLAFLSLAMFSANIIITKLASSRLNLNLGFLISITVNVLFSLLLFLFHTLFREDALQFHMGGFLLFLLSGFFATYLGRWFFFETIARLGPARASAFQISNPLFTVLISWVFLGEILGWGEMVAVITILFGLFLVSYVPSGKRAETKDSISAKETVVSSGNSTKCTTWWRNFIHSGVLLALFSSLAYALGNITRGTAVQNWNEPILGGLIGAAVGFLLHAVLSFNWDGIAEQYRQADRIGVVLYIASGILTISAQILYIASMYWLPISIATLITLSTPLFVFPLSYFLLKNQEDIRLQTVIGCALVLVGISYIVLY